MAPKRTHELYSKDTGLEITAETKENGKKEGFVQLRFFSLQPPVEGKTTQIKFLMAPFEAYDLSLKINKVFREGGKQTITHKFKQGDVEISTKVTVEKWERGDKGGFGIAVGRSGSQEGFISVPLGKESAGHFLFVAEFLKYLSTAQSWVDKP